MTPNDHHELAQIDRISRATRPQQTSCNPWAVIGAIAVVGLFLTLLGWTL